MYKTINNERGAFPAQTLHELREGGFLKIHENQIKPASFDTVISDEIYHLPKGVFQVPRGQEILSFAKNYNLIAKHGMEDPLLVNEAYLVKVADSVTLMSDVYGYANPKSSSGRLDLHCRLLADGVGAYDTLPKNWAGNLWILVEPKSFPILLKPGESLNQIRLFNGDARLSRAELEFNLGEGLLWQHPIATGLKRKCIMPQDLIPQDYDFDSLLLSIGLSGEDIGWVAKQSNSMLPIDISKIGHYLWSDYFEKLEKNPQKILSLDSGRFYILTTSEHVRVPENMACEMRPMDDRLGDYKAHYAGFIDPGWGCSDNGYSGRPLTLEVRPFEKMIVSDLQPIARIKYEYLTEYASIQYDQMESNYKIQNGPKLAKQFKV
jgi:dCTP deaminase